MQLMDIRFVVGHVEDCKHVLAGQMVKWQEQQDRTSLQYR